MRFKNFLFSLLIIALSLSSTINAQSANTSVDNYRPQIGMIYSIWHCIATKAPNNTVISQALDTKRWGPLGNLHWREIPKNSKIEDYCLNRNENLLDLHLNQFKQSQVDFLVVNLPYFCSLPDTNESIAGCLSIDSDTKKNIDLLMQKAATTPGSPKIVFWLPLKGSLVDYVINKMKQYPATNYHFEGAPLLIASWIKERNLNQVENKINELKSHFTIKKMWGKAEKESIQAYGSDVWSFMDACQEDFIKSKGDKACLQHGTAEMTSVSPSYQVSFITDFKTSAPRFGTRTLMRQFETAIARRSKIILLNSWNEWVDQRLCYNSPDLKFVNNEAKCAENVSEFGPNGTPGFINQFTREYSRDIEPDKTNSETYEVFQYLVNLAKSGTHSITPLPEPTRPTSPLPNDQSSATNSNYYPLNSNVRGVDFKSAFSPDRVFYDGDFALLQSAAGTNSAAGLSQIRIFIPPGTVQISVTTSAYLANEDGRVAASFRTLPRARASDVRTNTNYSGQNLLSALLERGEEVHFYGPPRSGGIMLLNPGAEKINPVQNGGWLYLNFLSIPGGTIYNIQTRVTVDKACYLNWYGQAQWDASGNPEEGAQHSCR